MAANSTPSPSAKRSLWPTIVSFSQYAGQVGEDTSWTVARTTATQGYWCSAMW
jgi:hypothetical protein